VRGGAALASTPSKQRWRQHESVALAPTLGRNAQQTVVNSKICKRYAKQLCCFALDASKQPASS